MSGRDQEPRAGGLSFAVLAIGVVGSAVAVLVVVAVLVAVLPVSPAVKAIVVLVGLVVAVAAMAVASRRLTARAIERAYGPPDDRPGAVADPDDAPRHGDGAPIH